MSLGVAVAIGLMVAGVILLFLMWRPNLSLLLIAALTPMRVFIIMVLPGFYYFSYAIDLIIIALIWSAGGIKILMRQGHIERVPWWPYVLLLLSVIAVWAQLPLSRDGELGFKYAVIFSVEDVAMIISPLLLIHHFRDVRRFTTYMILVGLVVTVSLLVLGAGTAQSGFERVTVGLASPLSMADAASLMVICVAIALICRPNALTWLLGLPAIALGVLATYRTGSRGQLGMQVLITLFGVYLIRKYRPALATVTVVLVLVAVLMATVFVLQLPPDSRYSAKNIMDATLLRWEMTRISFENWISRVLIGYGPGDSAVQLRPYFGDKSTHPHNMYIAALNELGLIGALPLFGFWFLSLAGMRRAWRYASDMAQRQTVLTIICLTTYYMVISTKTGTYTGSPLRAFLLGMGLVLPQVLNPSTHQASLSEWDDLPRIEPAYSDKVPSEI